MHTDSAETRANSTNSTSFPTPKVITNSYSFNNIKRTTTHNTSNGGIVVLDQNTNVVLEGTTQILTQTLHQGNGENFRTKIIAAVAAGKRNSQNLGSTVNAASEQSTILSDDNFNNNNANTATNNSNNPLARRGCPPKAHHHKLPSAFAFSNIPPPKKIKPGLLAMNIIPHSKLNDETENIAKKIDNMVDVSEYKQIQNLLSPLKIREGKVVHNKQKKLFSFHEQSSSTTNNNNNNTSMTIAQNNPNTSLINISSSTQQQQQQTSSSSSSTTTTATLATTPAAGSLAIPITGNTTAAIPSSSIGVVSQKNGMGMTLMNPLESLSLNKKTISPALTNMPISSNPFRKEKIPTQQIFYPQSTSSLLMNPLREYMETMQRFKDQFKETPDLLLDKINTFIMNNERSAISVSSSNNIVIPELLPRKPFGMKQPKDDAGNSSQSVGISFKSHSSLGGGNGTNTNSSSTANAAVQNFKVKLEEMITLNMLTSNRNSGIMKKMLHAPTLAIFAVKEQPIGSKEVRKILRDWLQFWPSSLNSNEQFIRVYGTCWNVPEGCVSIIMEHVNGGSLQDLLENVGNLNEKALQELAMQILSALYSLHTEHSITHGNISPSQILFNKTGFLKLSLGVTSRTQAQNNVNNNNNNNNNNIFHTISNFKGDKKTLYDHSSLASVWAKNTLERQEEISQIQQSIDRCEEVFKFGLLLLVSAIGSLDLLDDSFATFFEQVQKKIEQSNNPLNTANDSSQSSDATASSSSSTSCCSCFIHDEANIIQQLRKQSNSKSPQKGMTTTTQSPLIQQNNSSSITLEKLLGKFSDSFKNLLCSCLQYNYKKRATIQDLLQHSFIKNKITAGSTAAAAQPSLCELIAVSNKISMQTESLPDRYQAASERQLDRVCEGIQMILPNCSAWFKVPHYADFVQHLPLLEYNNPFILALANDLGIQPVKVHAKILAAYESVPLFKEFKHKFIFKPS